MTMFNYRKAERHDVVRLQCLINSAYRGKNSQSWTSEYGIVDGDCIDTRQLYCLLTKKGFVLWIVENIGDGAL